MIAASDKLAVFAPYCLAQTRAKMAHGVLRFSPHHVVCAIDPDQAGKSTADLVTGIRHDVPVVQDVAAAAEIGATVLVLGIAPLGGQIPSDWWPVLQQALDCGLSIVNGLHEQLTGRLTIPENRWVWDIRKEPEHLPTAARRSATLSCPRLLTIGTDMSVGKMTTGLILREAMEKMGLACEFVATGQIGITIAGTGVPLDAIRLDFAAGAIEQAVLEAASRKPDLIIIEGQGSLLHPASSATLPLLRGSCPTHLLLCTRADIPHLKDFADIIIPPLPKVLDIYLALTAMLDIFPNPKIAGIALNTSILSAAEAESCISQLAKETNLPCTDPVRFGMTSIATHLRQLM